MAHSSDQKKVIAKLRQQGWVVVMGGKHMKAIPPDKKYRCVWMSVSPSDANALRQAIRELKKSGAQL